MVTIKSYTDIEQSRKLAEILPIDSADMHYNNASIKGINYVDEYRAELMNYNTAQKVLSKYLVNPMFEIIPCWSLASLLEVLPILERKGYQKDKPRLLYNVTINKWIVDSHIYTTNAYNNPVDACVSMIEKLHELKML